MFEGTVVWKLKFDASMRKDIMILKNSWFQPQLNLKVSVTANKVRFQRANAVKCIYITVDRGC